MVARAAFRAFVTRDKSSIQMIRGDWRHRIPVADLPRWLRLYRSLRDRGAQRDGAGPWAAFYRDSVVALETIQKQVTG